MSSLTKQILSVIISLVVYTLWIGWQGAVLLVVCIAFHEQCHLWAAQRVGLKTNRWYLIPFVGGISLVMTRPKTYAKKAFYVLAGPVGGGAFGLLTMAAYYLTGCQYNWIASAAFVMLFLNLFNTAPLSFMDGGQLMGTITYSINRTLGVVCLTVSAVIASAALIYLSPILGIFLTLFGGLSVLHEIRNLRAWRRGQMYLCSDDWLFAPKKLSVKQMVVVGSSWFAAIMVLATAMGILAVEHKDAVRYFFSR